MDTSYRESIIYSDQDSSPNSTVSELSDIEEQLVPQTETTFQDDHDERPRLIQTRSAPILSLNEIERLQMMGQWTESLTRPRGFDWSESAYTGLERQVLGLKTLKFESIRQKNRRIHFQDEPMIFSDGSNSDEDVEEESEQTEPVKFDQTPKESDNERESHHSAQGTLSKARDDLYAKYQRFLTSNMDEEAQNEARLISELGVREHLEREKSDSTEDLICTQDPLMIEYIPNRKPDLLITEELKREMIASLREQIQEDCSLDIIFWATRTP